MIIVISILFFLVCIVLIERSYKIYRFKKLLTAQSTEIIAYKNKQEEFAIQMSQINRNSISNSKSQLIHKQDFDKQFNHLIAQSKRFNNLFAAIMLELNKVKVSNNENVSTLKEKLLIEIGKRLKKTIRDIDLVSRYTDDAFMVLFPNMIKPEVIVHGVERVIQQLSMPFEVEGKIIEISVCIGIVIYPFDGEDSATLLEHVKVALGKAKAEGENIFQFYQAETQALGYRELNLKSVIKSEDLFQNLLLEYKPYYNTLNQELVCIEVVATLDHPELGKVPFSEVIRVAHYSSRIFELYEWMMKTARDKFMLSNGPKPMRFIFSFNVTQFDRPQFLINIITMIKKMTSNQIEIIMEITDENVGSRNLELFRDAILKLNESHISIAVGILELGHFAMNKLDHVLFSYLRIDEKLVKDINKRQESKALLEKIMTLINDSNIRALSTGVDTEEQKQILENLGCIIMQGKALNKGRLESFFL